MPYPDDVVVTDAAREFMNRSLISGYVDAGLFGFILGEVVPDVEYTFTTELICWYLNDSDGTWASTTVEVSKKMRLEINSRITVIDSALALATDKVVYTVESFTQDITGTDVTITYVLR